MVKLHDIQGEYDLIVSLGCSCEPAGHLQRKGLRTFSAPLDWVVSLSLTQVNHLLENRFKDYMLIENMSITEGSAYYVKDEIVQEAKSYFIKDAMYDILSVHDFPVIPDHFWMEHYPDFKAKLDTRVERVLQRMAASKKALFVRWCGSDEEVVELQRVLRLLTPAAFNILLVNGVHGQGTTIDLDIPQDGICSLTIPYRDGDEQTWDLLLEGVSLLT
ncbi:hypothetical protein J2Z69_000654 [Paenibacillus shirakamiensis]|uniref:Peptidase n=1 Tax=Paenibacillus shirakamiensis TaxID=1265935 RepID=A0ABS4JD87_9BACL|nr:DUF1796 family putative cysteine peptidase [Paenibacillus shirakamiensis]MBP1999635.1 hypothetical protein [Paenibacillus shirakamiensis]